MLDSIVFEDYNLSLFKNESAKCFIAWFSSLEAEKNGASVLSGNCLGHCPAYFCLLKSMSLGKTTESVFN